MRQYGAQLGIAFQLIDDALDYCGDAGTIGKNIGDDLSEGKVTLPLIHALETGSGAERAIIIEAIESDDHMPYLDKIQAAIDSTGAIEYTQKAAEKHAEHAKAMLIDHIDDSPYRQALIKLADFAVAREH